MVFSSKEEQRSYIYPRYKKFFPSYQSGGEKLITNLKEYIQSFVGTSISVLDLGCGSEGISSVFLRQYPQVHVTGVDIDDEAGKNNRYIHEYIHADVYHLPFPDKSFDYIVSEFVFEHLEYPEKAAQEMFRVLKPGGKISILTPSLWNIAMLVSRITPQCFHDFYLKKFLKQEKKAFPTFYRANTVRVLKNIFSQGNISYERASNPEYIALSRYTLFLAIIYDYFAEFRLFYPIKNYIIFHIKK